jgi:hypothetical protein
VGSVAKDRVRGVLASTEENSFGFSRIKFDGRMVSGFVAAIAERLVRTQAARAPEIAFTGFNQDWVRTLLCNLRFRHREISSTGDKEIIAEKAG